MYRLGEIHHSYRRFYAWFAGVAVFLVLAGFTGAHFLKSNQHIGKTPPPVTKKITYDTTQHVSFNEKLFSISLPGDWKPAVIKDVPQPTFSWQGTVGDGKSRWLSVFVDANVENIAVNRELAVQANQTSIDVLGDVSDNCTTFTGGSTNTGQGTAPAKWQGINFLCDTGNYQRDVVGIVSPDGLNTVAVTGAAGTHHYFFTYTDNSASPDYTIFTNALKSFQAK